jgi:hypothetical protein
MGWNGKVQALTCPSSIADCNDVGFVNSHSFYKGFPLAQFVSCCLCLANHGGGDHCEQRLVDEHCSSKGQVRHVCGGTGSWCGGTLLLKLLRAVYVRGLIFPYDYDFIFGSPS